MLNSESNAVLFLSEHIIIIIHPSSILSYFSRLEDALKSEERRFLWRGIQLASEEEAGAGCPPALPGHADLPG